MSETPKPSTAPRRRTVAAAWKILNEDISSCRLCPRLAEYTAAVAREKRRAYRDDTYWGRPVPNFGDPRAPLLIVGLAPAAHGANRTGRMFTGDRSGEWLYAALYRAGFANQPTAVSADDGLRLIDCAITATCHCAPPDNKPTREEMQACRRWLDETIDLVQPRVLLALGKIAWDACVAAMRARGATDRSRKVFGHGACIPLAADRWLVGSYHPSQQNTFTGKLTHEMLDDVFAQARRLLSAPRAS